MRTTTVKADVLLLFTAAIWGFAFVAQRAGMEYVGPFIFNGVRFALGSLSLIPLLLLGRRRHTTYKAIQSRANTKMVILGSSLAGFVLFMGASLQQIGIVYTTAGNAGFITGLYVIIVPILGVLLRQRIGLGTWLGAIIAAVGLYLLSITETLSISVGDFLVLVSAFFWAGHVHVIGWLSPKCDAIKLASFQFSACSLLSLITAVFVETITLQGLIDAAIPILYGGLFSVGVAYTLQVVAQRDAHPGHVAIILSLEGVFAAFGGWLLLGEILSIRGMFGCALMLAGMILSRFNITAESLRVSVKNLSTEMET